MIVIRKALAASLLVGALLASLAIPLSALAAFLFLVLLVLLRPNAQAVWQGTPLDYLMLGWLVWAPSTLFWSMAPGLAVESLAALICLPLCYWLGVRLKQDCSDLESYALILMTILLVILSIWGVTQDPNETFTGKPQGPFVDPNTYAGVLNLLAFPLVAAYLSADLKNEVAWLRTGRLAALAVAAFAFFLVSSRGASLPLFLLAPLLFWHARLRRDIQRKSALLAVVAIVAYGAASLCVSERQDIVYRLIVTTQTGDSSRMMLFRSAWAMIEDQPWVGSGLGSFQLLYPRYRDPDEIGTAGGWVHNDYLQLWLEAGLPMFALVVALLFLVGRDIFFGASIGEPSKRLMRMGWLLGVMAVLMQAVVNFMLYFPMVSGLIGFNLALGGASNGRFGALSKKHQRARTLGIYAYMFILAYLFVGQLAIESLVSGSRRVGQAILKMPGVASGYDASHLVSIMQPFHHAPHYMMGSYLSDPFNALTAGAGLRRAMLRESLVHYERALELVPCYLPYGIDVAKVWMSLGGEEGNSQAEKVLRQNLLCNPGHGLTYYYLANITKTARGAQQATAIYRSGLENSPRPIDRLLLATAASGLLAGNKDELTKLAESMADQLLYIERNPTVKIDRKFWNDAEYTLIKNEPKMYLRWVSMAGKL